MQLASQTRLLISGSVLASRVSKAGGAEMAPEGIWHSGWPRARAWQKCLADQVWRDYAPDEIRLDFDTTAFLRNWADGG